MKEKITKIKYLTEVKRRGSPLVEHGILIGLGIFVFLIIFAQVQNILSWFMELADELLDILTII